jgi:hypothetical protein
MLDRLSVDVLWQVLLPFVDIMDNGTTSLQATNVYLYQQIQKYLSQFVHHRLGVNMSSREVAWIMS